MNKSRKQMQTKLNYNSRITELWTNNLRGDMPLKSQNQLFKTPVHSAKSLHGVQEKELNNIMNQLTFQLPISNQRVMTRTHSLVKVQTRIKTKAGLLQESKVQVALALQMKKILPQNSMFQHSEIYRILYNQTYNQAKVIQNSKPSNKTKRRDCRQHKLVKLSRKIQLIIFAFWQFFSYWQVQEFCL